ncbi:MAG TPA: glycosyltransferase, partial [Flavobacteriales bacterium]|nr:glycosyltransferase [Flavobacteriales bacterium]
MENRKAGSLNTYLTKHAFVPKQIPETPAEDLGIVVVIPCFNEPDILRILSSLKNCDSPKCSVEIVIVFNCPEDASILVKQTNQKRSEEARNFSKEHGRKHFQIHTIVADQLPTKHAGVGLARKIGMDEAVRRFDLTENHLGLILNVDADCTVATNYLSEILDGFAKNEKINAASIRYEHMLSGPEPQEVYKAIVLYELYLRYYIRGLRFANYPFAFQTLGSCMVVRSSTYQQQGGMNKRKAGEDFYFLHKIMPLGGFVEINSTCVYPSPRV